MDRQWRPRLPTSLEDGRNFCNGGRYADAVHALRRGWSVPRPYRRSGASPGHWKLSSAWPSGGRLHYLAEQVHFDMASNRSASVEATKILHNIRVIWDSRRRLFPTDGTGLDSVLDRQVRADLLELVIVWAEIRVRLTHRASYRKRETSRSDYWRRLGPVADPASRSIDCDDRWAPDAGRIGRAAQADPVPPSASEHYDLGRSYLRS